MLIYTLIFLVSVVLAAVILVLYRSVSESRSILNSRAPVILTDHAAGGTGDSVKPRAATTPSHAARKQTRRATPQNLNTPYPATPVGQISLDWEDCRSEVSERNHGHAGAVSVSRCSLYDVSTPDSTVSNKGGIDWSFGEETHTPGRASSIENQKARPKATRTPSDMESSGKPWGW